MGDLPRFKALFADEAIHIHMGGLMHHDTSELDCIFERVLKKYSDPSPDRYFSIWGIEYKEQLIGHFELKETNYTTMGELEVVYFLDPKYWRMGLMTEVLAAVRTHGSKAGYTVIATIDPENKASIGLLEKMGIEEIEELTDDEGIVLKVRLK